MTFEMPLNATPQTMVRFVSAGMTRHTPRGTSGAAWFLSGHTRILWRNSIPQQLWTTDASGGSRHVLRDLIGPQCPQKRHHWQNLDAVPGHTPPGFE